MYNLISTVLALLKTVILGLVARVRLPQELVSKLIHNVFKYCQTEETVHPVILNSSNVSTILYRLSSHGSLN